jgi:hypothetical protein
VTNEIMVINVIYYRQQIQLLNAINVVSESMKWRRSSLIKVLITKAVLDVHTATEYSGRSDLQWTNELAHVV